MNPFIQLSQGGITMDSTKVDLLAVDFPMSDWRQTLHITAKLEFDAEKPLFVYGGHYPHGKTNLFKGVLTQRKSANEYLFHTAFPRKFVKQTRMDTTPQAALSEEFVEFGLEVEFQETDMRHEVVFNGLFYERIQRLALKETPYRSWWVTPEGKAWWGKITESPRWNVNPIWLDTRQDIKKIDTKKKQANIVFMPWVRGGHCVILDDPIDKEELTQTVAYNVTHRYERDNGFFTSISYI